MKSIISAFFFFASVALHAQVYELNDLLKMADSANQTLRNANLDIEMNTFQKKAYLSSRLPKVTASGDYKYNAVLPGQIVPAEFFGGPAGTYSQVKFGVPYNLNNSIQLSQILYNPQVNYGLNALDINQQIVELQYRLAEQEVKSQVANTYFNLQALIRQIEFLDQNSKNMSELIKNMSLMVEQGMVIPTELDKLKMNKISIDNSILKFENTKYQLESLLKILVGLPPNSTIQLAQDEVLRQTILVDNAAINRPELALIEAQKQMNIEEKKGNKMSYLPSLSFYTQYNYNYNLKPEDDFRTGIHSAFLGLRLDWTLFDGFEKYNKLKINALNKEKIENQEQVLTQQLNLATENAKNDIEYQSSNLNASLEQLKLAENIFSVSNAQFALGTISTNELIQSNTALQQAQSNVVSSYIQLRQAELSYLKSIGSIK